MRNVGKSPVEGKGYATDTVSGRAYRLDAFYQWIWDQEGRYPTQITHDYADEWMRELASSVDMT